MEQKKYGIESLIETITKDLESKSDFKGRWCEHYTEDCKGKMRNYANTGYLCDNKCEYCEKFKFVINRAKEYAEAGSTTLEKVLESWESNRDYWFLNYYQEANQPSLKKVNLIIDEPSDLMEKYGAKGFRCPCCGGVSKDPQECDSGIIINDINPNKGKHPCNWCSYGLFRSNYTVFVKSKLLSTSIFKPMEIWEAQEHIKINIEKIPNSRKYNIKVFSDKKDGILEEANLMKTAKANLISEYRRLYGTDCVKINE